ncbi:MAG: hypothetical protein ACJAWA_000882 [Nonlabens sp.]|jgi:hypothetical protein
MHLLGQSSIGKWNRVFNSHPTIFFVVEHYLYSTIINTIQRGMIDIKVFGIIKKSDKTDLIFKNPLFNN